MDNDLKHGKRVHIGDSQGELKIVPERSVFINCPYDKEFEPIFDAIVLATVCCGFLPRSALETGNVADSRMERITNAILSSKYSIHDLSRCTGEGDEQLARFNMPLELGIAMAQRYAKVHKNKRHDWLLLVPEGHQYTKFISDLAGFDPMKYDGTEKAAVAKVMTWLAMRPDAVRTLKTIQVYEALPDFHKAKEQLKVEWGTDPPWSDLVLKAREFDKKLWENKLALEGASARADLPL
jgi:hypothetical protein